MNSPQNPDGDVGTELLMENEHVKVWNLDLQPGQSSQCTITITGT